MGEEKKKSKGLILQIAAYLAVPVSILYTELLFSLLLHYRMSLYDVGFSLAAAALIMTVSMLFPFRRVQYAIACVLTGLVTLLYLTQFLYNRIFSTLYFVQSLKGAGKAAAFADILFGKIRDNAGWILLFLLPLVLLLIFQRIFLREIKYMRRIPAILLSAFLVIGAGTTAAVLTDKDGALSPRYLFLNSFVQEKSLSDFGLITTMNLDLKYNVLNLKSNDEADIDLDQIKIIEKAAAAGTTAGETAADANEPEMTPAANETGADAAASPTPTPTPTPYAPNIMDIDFPADETDGTLQEMNEYFSTREATLTNDYSGMFEGKNLILITAEGFSKYVIDPERTPTLYKLATSGFVFNNFYTPIWGVSTSDGEYVATTGLIPKAGVWSYTKIADNLMPFAFGNQFADLGYVTKAYHDHTYTYYNRDQSYPTMGYDYKGVGNGLDVKVTWPESDLEMMQLTVPEYVNDAPFHVYYMSVSGHLEYNFSGNYISVKNQDLVKDLPYSPHVQAYLACQKELDLALENLLTQLEAAGQLENTVIAISADHYPYGLTSDEFDELAGHDLEKTFEMYKSAFILWSGDMTEPVVVDKSCSSLDIAPTLANLFGLTYDSRLYMGTDILSETSPTVIFQDHSFITDKIMFNASSQEVTMLTGETLPDEEIKSLIRAVNDKFKYSALIIDKDYYRYLFEGKST